MEKAQMHSIRTDVEKIVKATAEPDAKLMKICQLLKETVDHYDWVGFYLVDTAQQGELVLGPFVGAPTEHQRIRFGQGICGQAAETEETFIIQDVAQETNYLSCSPNVKSEIVVPVFKEGVLVGELDIDSHMLAPFNNAERVFLEEICALVAQIL